MYQRLLFGLLLLTINVVTKATNPAYYTVYTPNTVLSDTTDPVIICPASFSVQMAPLRCDTVLEYTVTASDDTDDPILIQLTGKPSGAAFPVGETVNRFLATDFSGNTATCSFTITVIENSDQILNCLDLVQVKLNPNCTKTLDPFEVMDEGQYGCPANFIVELDKTMPFGNGPWVPAVLGPADVGKQYQVRVTYASPIVNRCWGLVEVRDSTPPIISALDVSVPCTLPISQLTPSFLRDSLLILTGQPTVSDACGNAMITLTYADIQQNLPCNDTSTISGIVRRTWTATDVSGNSSTKEQIIYRRRLLSEVSIPGPGTALCTASSFPTSTYGVPFILFKNRKYPITPQSYCEFDIQHVDSIQAGACPGNYTLRRTWKIYDACLPFSPSNPKIGVQNIDVHDNTGPILHCPHDTVITVAAINCRAAINLPDLTISDNCSGVVNLEAFWSDSSLTKVLAGTVQINTDSTGVDTVGVFGVVSSFPLGLTTMLYVANDQCGNTGDCSFSIVVTNGVPPTAKCDSLLLVGLPTDGYLKIPAAVLDNGSADDCTTVFFKAKLSSANACESNLMLSDTLHVCCQNLGDTLAGTLRVYDVPPPPGNVANNYGSGHYTDCNFKIKVSGANAPHCTAPANVTVSCEDFDPTLQAYGGLVAQSCSVDSIAITANYTNFDTLCLRGTITRQFKVFTATGQSATCSQKIVSNYMQDYYVRFPNDVIVTACDTLSNYGAPTFFGKDCELLSAVFDDEVFEIVPDACFKIERTWRVINWCTYDPNVSVITIPNPNPNAVTNHPDNLPGPVVSPVSIVGDPWKSTFVKINPTDPLPTNYNIFYNAAANGYEYKQIIKIIDTEDPKIQSCPGSTSVVVSDQTNNDPLLWKGQGWYDPMNLTNDLCEAPADFCITATDACSGADIKIDFQLFLDLDGDGILETVVNSTMLGSQPGGLGWNNIMYGNFTGAGESRQFDQRPVPTNQKWGFAMQQTVVGRNRTACVKFNTFQSPNVYQPVQLPPGTHRINWFVTDNCGNVIICQYYIKIKDGKSPDVTCMGPLSVNLPPSGSVELSATDFLYNGEDNCTLPDNLKYGIRREGAGGGFPVDGNGNILDKLMYTCFDVDSIPAKVELWCIDLGGNLDSCHVDITIRDTSGYCGNNSTDVDGHVLTELGEGIEDVTLFVENPNDPLAPPSNIFEKTDSLGIYNFGASLNGLPAITLTLRPELDNDPLNGVTTFDLVQISKHILGIQPLGSLYKMIAADANKSNSITTFDIVELRKLILGVYQVLPHNTSWRFVPTSYVFPSQTTPFQPPFPEVIDLLPAAIDGNFVGIKIGDVNNTTIPHASGALDERSLGLAQLDVSFAGSGELQAGAAFDVTFRTAEPMQGCQFTLNHPGVEVLNVVPVAGISADQMAFFPEKEAMTVAWETGGDMAFTLKCRATQAGNMREMFAIGSDITKAEAYKTTNASEIEIGRYDLGLRFPELTEFALFQNQPNPFSDKTAITFNLPEASEATLQIFDANGRLLFTHSAFYAKGLQTVMVEKSALKASGILFYQVDTQKHNGVRKMIAQ